MKKYFSIVLSLILTVLMVVSFAGCDSKSDGKDNDKNKNESVSSAGEVSESKANALVGTWTGTMYYEEFRVSEQFDVEVVFGADGMFEINIDEDDMYEFSKKQILETYYGDDYVIEDILEEENMTQDEFDAWVTEEIGELNNTISNNYEYDGETFKIGSSEKEYELTDTTMKFEYDFSRTLELKKLS